MAQLLKFVLMNFLSAAAHVRHVVCQNEIWPLDRLESLSVARARTLRHIRLQGKHAALSDGAVSEIISEAPCASVVCRRYHAWGIRRSSMHVMQFALQLNPVAYSTMLIDPAPGNRRAPTNRSNSTAVQEVASSQEFHR